MEKNIVSDSPQGGVENHLWRSQAIWGTLVLIDELTKTHHRRHYFILAALFDREFWIQENEEPGDFTTKTFGNLIANNFTEYYAGAQRVVEFRTAQSDLRNLLEKGLIYNDEVLDWRITPAGVVFMSELADKFGNLIVLQHNALNSIDSDKTSSREVKIKPYNRAGGILSRFKNLDSKREKLIMSLKAILGGILIVVVLSSVGPRDFGDGTLTQPITSYAFS